MCKSSPKSSSGSGDPAVKQILVYMDSTSNDHFIIQDLDDTHLVIKADAVNNVLRNLEAEVSIIMLISNYLL